MTRLISLTIKILLLIVAIPFLAAFGTGAYMFVLLLSGLLEIVSFILLVTAPWLVILGGTLLFALTLGFLVRMLAVRS